MSRSGRPTLPKEPPESDRRLVYVMPEYGSGPSENDEVSLRDLWHVLVRGKWLIIAVTAAFAAGSLLYAVMAEEWYRSDVLLAPTDAKSTPSFGGQLGGLAALAGVSVGGGGGAESLAVLTSRDFVRGFIEEHDLMPILFEEQWNASQGTWALARNEDAPDIREAVKFFLEHVLKVQEHRDTGLVTVAVEWTDPALAAEWVAILVRRLNDTLRVRALQEAEANVAYLQAQLGATSVVTLQQSIGRLLESELQKLMLAKGNEEFAFKVLDPAEVPWKHVRPKRAFVVILGIALGVMVGVIMAFLWHAMRAGHDLPRLEVDGRLDT